MRIVNAMNQRLIPRKMVDIESELGEYGEK